MSNTNAVPSFVLKVDGSRLPPESEADLKEIFIFEKTDAPSRFELKLNNEGFRWTDSDTLDVGAEVKISIGYKDALEEIMVGEITGIRANMRFGQANTVTYIGHSKSHRLVRGQSSRAFNEMTVTEIVEQLASDAGMQSDVENIPGARTFTLQKGLSNFNYLVSLADRYGCTINDVDNKLTFKRQVANSGEDSVIEYNKTLVEFYPTTDVNEQITGVEVRGWNRGQHQAIRGSKTHSDVSSEGGKLVEDSFGAAQEVVLDVRVADQNEADQLALDYITKAARGYINGYGVSLGDPAIRAGNIIKVEGVADRYKGKYYVYGAKHRLEIGVGYSTTFYVSSNVATQGNAANSTGSTAVGSGASGGGAQAGGAARAGAGAGAAAAAESNRNPQISNLKWLNESGEEIDKGYLGQKAVLAADVTDIDDGERVKMTIFTKDADDEEVRLEVRSVEIKGGKIEWNNSLDFIKSKAPVTGDEFVEPEYFFKIEARGHSIMEESGGLTTSVLDIELEIDPGLASSHDDKYTLFSCDDDKTYKMTLTVKDDRYGGNDSVDLHFLGVKEDLSYSMEVDPGADGDCYLVFEDIPYDKLK